MYNLTCHQGNTNQATAREYNTPIRMAKIEKKMTTPNADKYAEKLDHSYIAGRNVK